MKTDLRILNLEDSANDAELNHAMLSARWPQCRFTSVDNRKDFLAALDAGNLDLILSDYTMAGFNGLEALKLAQEKRPNVPFIFVSGTIGEDTAIEALKNGATDYVLKHRLMRLIPAVHRALREVEVQAECERSDEAMRQSEHKYREVFECLGDAAFLADEQTGKIIDTNRCAEKMLGCNRSEILGHKLSQFLSLAGQPGAAADAPFECLLNRNNGSHARVRVHTSRLAIHDHPLVLRLCHELGEG